MGGQSSSASTRRRTCADSSGRSRSVSCNSSRVTHAASSSCWRLSWTLPVQRGGAVVVERVGGGGVHLRSGTDQGSDRGRGARPGSRSCAPDTCRAERPHSERCIAAIDTSSTVAGVSEEFPARFITGFVPAASLVGRDPRQHPRDPVRSLRRRASLRSAHLCLRRQAVRAAEVPVRYW